jgi:hypothetical protein
VTVPYGSKSCTLTKADEEKLRIFERRILRKIYGPTCENGAWRIKFSDELYSLYKDPDISFIHFPFIPNLEHRAPRSRYSESNNSSQDKVARTLKSEWRRTHLAKR